MLLVRQSISDPDDPATGENKSGRSSLCRGGPVAGQDASECRTCKLSIIIIEILHPLALNWPSLGVGLEARGWTLDAPQKGKEVQAMHAIGFDFPGDCQELAPAVWIERALPDSRCTSMEESVRHQPDDCFTSGPLPLSLSIFGRFSVPSAHEPER